MENKRKIHQKRVERKGRCSKESHVIGEKVLVQNVVTKLWDREAVVTGIRTAADKTIVSYNLDIGGLQSKRHIKFLRKTVDLPYQDEADVEPVINADEGVIVTGQDTERGDMPSQRPLRCSARL